MRRFTVVSLLLGALRVQAAPAGVPDRPEALGLPPGASMSFALAASDSGWVAGWGMGIDGVGRAIVRPPGGSMTALPVPDAVQWCTARAVDVGGRAVASCAGFDAAHRLVRRAIVWQNGAFSTLAGLPGATQDDAGGIDALGRVAGRSSGVSPSGEAFSRAVLWTDGVARDLGALPGGRSSEATAIGPSGHVVGFSRVAAAQGTPLHAFVWTEPEGMQDLGTLPGGGWSRASAVDSGGNVAGYGSVAGGATHPFLWTRAAGMRDLGLLPGATGCLASGLDDAGEVVGTCSFSDGHSEAFFRPTQGELQALPMPAGATFTAASAIDSAGVIVGAGNGVNESPLPHALRWPRRVAPLAAAGADQMLVCTAHRTPVTLDASASRPAGAGTVTYTWRENGVVLASSQQAVVTVALAVGIHDLELVASQNGVDSAPSRTMVTVTDTEPPVSTATTDPAPNARGWNRGPVRVELAAADRCSDIVQILHAVDGGAEISDAGAAASFVVATDGVHTVSRRTVDAAGNAETVSRFALRIDSVPPVLSAVATPPPDANGWNHGDVTVTFTATDALSGVASVSAPVRLSGSGTANGEALDNAGNGASLAVPVRIDRLPPVVVLTPQPAGGTRMWPPNHRMARQTISGRVVEDGGLAGGVLHVAVTSSEPDDAPGEGDGHTRGDTNGRDGFSAPVRFEVRPAADGTFSVSLALRAERAGGGPGRTYVVRITATDWSGQTTVVEQRYFVPHSMAERTRLVR